MHVFKLDDVRILTVLHTITPILFELFSTQLQYGHMLTV